MSGPPLIILAAGRARRFGGVKPLAPIGAQAEAVIDLLAGDAVAAGFGRIVLVVNPETGPTIQEHVSSSWPRSVDVCFATQVRPLGTVHAVLAARGSVDEQLPFAVANADDLYGREALAQLADHLSAGGGNALVGYRLENALVGEDPVTRGVCEVADGQLIAIAERRQVSSIDGAFVAGDGLEPSVIDPSSLVSMNLWGFAHEMWAAFDLAMMTAAHASEDAEVLLPEIVGRIVTGAFRVDPSSLTSVAVLPTEARCVGVTHPGDLAIVQADIVEQIARGERPQTPFGASRER